MSKSMPTITLSLTDLAILPMVYLPVFLMSRLYAKAPSAVRFEALGWGICFVFVAAGAAVAWRYRQQMILSLVVAMLLLIGAGMESAGLIASALGQELVGADIANGALIGIYSAGLGWIAAQTNGLFRDRRALLAVRP